MKLLLGVAAILFVGGAALTGFTLNRLDQVITAAEQNELHEHGAAVVNKIAAEERMAVALAEVVAGNTNAQQLFAEKNRDGLLKMYSNAFEKMKADYGVRQFQFHLPPAESFVRLHKPQKFGDDLSGFRKTVVQANETRKPVSGLEKGVAGLGIRGVVPMYAEGKHLGTVEFGMSIDQSFFDTMKEESKIDLALYVIDGENLKLFASTYGKESLLGDENLTFALDGVERVKDLEHNGQPVAVMSRLIKDYQGKTVGVLEIIKDRSAYMSYRSQIQYATLGICGITMLVSIVLANWLLNAMIKKPIGDVVIAMGRMAEGDLTHRFEDTQGDEISALRQSYNVFADEVSDLITQVSESSHEVLRAAEEVATTSRDIAEGMREQSRQIEQTASAVEEMSVSVDEVATQSHDATIEAKRSGEVANHGGAAVQQTINDINEVSASVSRGEESVKQLGERGQQISEIVTFINEIADQTNLLALNAAIEAARAGEYGRGFAVVADEVRSLADRTTKATEQIAQSIKTMQSETADAVELMNEGCERVNVGVTHVSEAGEYLEQIVDSAHMVSIKVEGIATAAEQQARASEQIAQAVESINQVTKQSEEATEQAASAGRHLATRAEALESLVERFKIAS